MKRTIPALAMTMIFIGGAILVTSISAAEPEKKPCCFSNPRFSGQCKVTPGPDEKCSDILAYLNAQNSVGKAYCGNTTVRGGWATVSCEEAKASGQQALHGASSYQQPENTSTQKKSPAVDTGGFQ